METTTHFDARKYNHRQFDTKLLFIPPHVQEVLLTVFPENVYLEVPWK